MADIRDIGLSAALNILGAISFLLAFTFLRLQPINDRVYFPKWYLKGARESPSHGGTFVRKFVNLDMRSYLKFLSWMPAALKMPEDELISHAGLDSAVYLRIYLVGYVICIPYSSVMLIAFVPHISISLTNCTRERRVRKWVIDIIVSLIIVLLCNIQNTFGELGKRNELVLPTLLLATLANSVLGLCSAWLCWLLFIRLLFSNWVSSLQDFLRKEKGIHSLQYISTESKHLQFPLALCFYCSLIDAHLHLSSALLIYFVSSVAGLKYLLQSQF